MSPLKPGFLPSASSVDLANKTSSNTEADCDSLANFTVEKAARIASS
jgi:hypothetical protein